MKQAAIAEQKSQPLTRSGWSSRNGAAPTTPSLRVSDSSRRPGTWRLAYKTEQGEGGRNGVVDIIVMSKTNQTLTAAYNLQGAASGVLTVKEAEPEYFLQVKSFGPRWRIAVERLE